MADVTLAVIWYKMGESYKRLAVGWDRLSDWYSDFSWKRVDLLDMLFLGWLLAAFVVVGAINLYLRFFGLPKSKRVADGGVGVRSGGVFSSGTPLMSGGESCQWLNSALSWLYLHYNNTPEIVEAWIRALNDQARKRAVNNGFQIKFERVQSGSLPPKVTRITTDPASMDILSLQAGVEATDMTLLVSAIQSTATNLKVTSCDVTVTKLQGQMHIHGDYSQETVQLTLTFARPPELKFTVNTRTYDTAIDKLEVEKVVREALSNASISICLDSRGGYPVFPGPGQLDQLSVQQRESDNLALFTDEIPTTSTALKEREALIDLKNKDNAVGPIGSQDRQLLVKIIKANGLGDKDFGCSNPYTVVEVDSPLQTHSTSVVKNTVNPFWDEHFLFNFDHLTKHVKFEVFDRERPSGDDFLGRALIALEELRRLPSSRQIIPLIGRPKASTTTSGSITVEFLFIDPAEASSLGLTADDSKSPRRRIETNTRVTPGGTFVTTTTTTTEKPKDHRHDPFYNETPGRVERPSDVLGGVSSYSPVGDYSTYSSNSRGSPHLEAHDAALSASQASTLRRGLGSQAASPKLTVTRPEMMAMHEPGRYDEMRDTMSTTSSDIHPKEILIKLNAASTEELAVESASKPEKKKSSFASTLKRKFGRPKKRSQSADRAFSSSFKESSLLKPPEHKDPGPQYKTAEDVDRVTMPDGSLRKARSRSFSNSLKQLFKKKKSKDIDSREGSLSRASGPVSREGSVTQPSPNMYRDDGRQPSPGLEYTHTSKKTRTS